MDIQSPRWTNNPRHCFRNRYNHYDASAFIYPEDTEQHQDDTKNNLRRRKIQSATTIQPILSKPPPYQRPPPSSLPLLIPEKEKYLQLSRRTHVHTQLAVKKLSSLLIGQISHPTNEFDPLEYRRYGLVEKTSLDSASRLKFCLLYPYTDGRVNEPIEFLPGQSVQICVKVKGRNGGKELITRYFTPISGSLTSFEIECKFVTGGLMSDFLKRLKKGTRQIKIRGPFWGTDC